jgi:hypothetical protein
MVTSTPTFSALSSISTPSSYPASNKCYLQGSRPEQRVPYREVILSATRHSSHTSAVPSTQKLGAPFAWRTDGLHNSLQYAIR